MIVREVGSGTMKDLNFRKIICYSVDNGMGQPQGMRLFAGIGASWRMD